MKKLIFLAISLFPLIGKAQDVNQNVIPASGDYSENTNGSLSWTIGEISTETFESNDKSLTQGFQQSNLTVTFIGETSVKTGIKVYPNPVDEILYIETQKKDLTFQLYNMEGILIKEGKINNNKEKINFENLQSGFYILQTGDKISHRIIKK